MLLSVHIHLNVRIYHLLAVPKIKAVLKGKRFNTIPDIEMTTSKQLKGSSRNALNHIINVGMSKSLPKESVLKEINLSLMSAYYFHNKIIHPIYDHTS